MIHGKPVAYADCKKLERNPAGVANPVFNSPRYFVQVRMPRDIIARRAYDGDKRLFHFGVGKPQRFQKRPVGQTLDAFGQYFTSHNILPFLRLYI